MGIILIGMFEPRSRLEFEKEKEMRKERELLIEELDKFGLPFEVVNEKWPRDIFVEHKGRVHTRRKFGNYADGGYLLNFPEFTIACAAVSEGENGTADKPEKRYSLLTSLYGEKVYLFPPINLKLNPYLRQHIDMVVLPIPQRRAMFVDENYFLSAKDAVNRVCEEQGFKLRTIGTDYRRPSWPCNTFILEDSGKTFAVTNSVKNEDFVKLLSAYDINVLAVPFSANCSQGGSVHCATNTISQRNLGLVGKLFEDFDAS